MAIFLLILKIIGITLLSVLGLLIFLILLILFVPIRYSFYADKNDTSNFKLKAKVTYLLHLVTVTVSSENNYDVIIRILGIRLKKRKKKDTDDNTAEDNRQEPSYKVDWNDEEHVIDTHTPDTDKEIASEAISDNSDNSEVVINDSEVADNTEEEETDDELNLSFVQKVKLFISKLAAIPEKITDIYNEGTVKINNIADKVSDSSKKINAFYNLINDYHNKRAIKHIWNQLGYIIKKLLPRILRVRACIGFEDPATTGSILAMVGFLAPIIPGQIEIVPNFDEERLEGEVFFKGKITPCIFIVVLWKLFFNRDVRRLWKIYRGKNTK